MKKTKIIIDLMMTNSCNRTCEYCPLNFDGEFIDKAQIDYIIEYLDSNKDNYKECTLNFFGGEPLLNFENIKYFIEKNTNDKIKYSIGTNGILLTEDKLDFFIQHNVTIFLTFHADNSKTYKKLLAKKYLSKGFGIIQINFIVDPTIVDYSYEKIDETVAFGFKKINIIPVMLTKKWDKEALIELKKFINYVDQEYIVNSLYKGCKIYKFSYFDGIPVELGFVLDTNLNIYYDSSDELFMGKNYKLLGDDLIQKIEKATFIGNIQDISDLGKVIDKYDIKSIVKLVHLLPLTLGYLQDYAIIYKIMNKNTNNRSKMSGNSYSVTNG